MYRDFVIPMRSFISSGHSPGKTISGRNVNLTPQLSNDINVKSTSFEICPVHENSKASNKEALSGERDKKKCKKNLMMGWSWILQKFPGAEYLLKL